MEFKAINAAIHQACLQDMTERRQHAFKFNMSKWHENVNTEQGDYVLLHQPMQHTKVAAFLKLNHTSSYFKKTSSSRSSIFQIAPLLGITSMTPNNTGAHQHVHQLEHHWLPPSPLASSTPPTPPAKNKALTALPTPGSHLLRLADKNGP